MTAVWRRGTLRAGPLPPAGLVIKVGGSLLGLGGWPAILADLVAHDPAALLVVGGGALVDGLRAIDAVHRRSPTLMHDLAIDAMSLTARIVADALGVPVVRTAAEPGVLDAAAWLRSSGRAAPLPAGWDVTSDSIAACVAAATGRGLLLAKRSPPPDEGPDLQRLAAAGWVDAHFPRAAATVLAIDWCAPA